ncbi:hypothetical protein [Stenotrophomonas maltophilia]|uniref:hypothetical protein n=1 Tax=Stenotrophomonas maltophilia TaxID=40324 RepID=UPI0019530627|nr:hypothetical protein [Stenotrophomonas maltophilia]
MTKKLTKRCRSMPISAHLAVMNEKAHQAKALMGFVISASWKPAPMASRGQCTPGFFKFCTVQGLLSCRHGQCLPNAANATPKQLNSHRGNPQQVVEPAA